MSPAFAHDGPHAATPVDLWTAWTVDPFVLVPLGLALWLYLRGMRASWERAGVGRGVRRWEAACFAGGAAALLFALVWPLDVLGEALFSAHMAQHLVLMNLAAPLLVLGAPLQVMLRAVPRAWRRAAAPFVPRPGIVLAAVLQQAVLWIWHTPPAIAAALENDAVHIAMHASLLIVALLFWTAVLWPPGRQYWAPIAALLFTLKLTGVICIVLMLRPGAIFGAYGELAAAWGLTPEQDEQLGWGLMMSAGTLAYLGAGVALVAASFARLERARPAPQARRSAPLSPGQVQAPGTLGAKHELLPKALRGTQR